MNFAKAGANVIVDQGFRQRHRLLSRAILPGVGPQMIAAQPHAIACQANLIRQAPQRIAELGRRLAGIAAELIDLVGRRLHQHRRTARFGLPQRGLQNPGMGGTDRKIPTGIPALCCSTSCNNCCMKPHAGALLPIGDDDLHAQLG